MMYEYPRALDFPNSGFAAGPCLLKDTMQLASFDKNYSRFAHTAMIVNEDLPNFIVSRIKQELNLKNKKVLILGMAFKPNNDDERSSLAFKLKKILEIEVKTLFCHDPYINKFSNVNLNKILKIVDIIFIGCPHHQYKNLKIDKKIKLVDCWNFFANDN
jgi:UDP-N-acetyl-D-mannosaminuronic acid dehydrogenase